MMIRLFITIGLCLSLVFMARGMVVTMKTDPLQTVAKHKKQKRGRPVPIFKPIRFYPPPPPVLPDLSSGYIFIEGRTIASKNDVEESQNGQQDIRVNINDVFYVGSVITDKYRKGIVSYPVSKTPAPTIKGRRVSSKATRQAKTEQAFLVQGDTLGGYKVTEVAADRIVFKKDNETIEKLLNDPDKKRKTVAPRSKSKTQSRARVTSSTAGRKSTKRSTAVKRPQQRRPPTTTTQTRPRPKTERMTDAEIRAMEQEIEQIEQQRAYQKR